MKPEKRLFDLFFASLLLLLSAPLWVVIAAALRLENRGPVFFRSWRHGYRGVPFAILKFRTMLSDTKRVTWLGDLLRRTCLDELPQLWNVLRGEMSLVGPRPLDVEESDELCRRFPSHGGRHAVRPGLTGSGQVNGMRGTLDEQEKAKRLAYDLHYVRHHSLWGDFKILAQTPWCVMRKFSQTINGGLSVWRWPDSGARGVLAPVINDTAIPSPRRLTVAELGA